ncbi:sensory transduction regulatory protein [hydrothermal vent metagenome]|uniref:Sensory transduction regulatory protein n=1 Tax=hydrothermal vent metagenome TaxID=652676 RepID=A0A1W1BRT3_9ZZZZ
MNVLIVEDESIVAMEIANYVKDLGYDVCCIAADAKRAYEAVKTQKIDLILMDVYIKGDIDGIECAKEIKSKRDIPLIYISAFSDDITLQRAIETDPNAYLIKPFNTKELQVAMSLAVKNLYPNKRIGDVVFDHEFSYDSKNEELLLNGEVVHLTKQERTLLKLLVLEKNNIVSIYEIENYIWPDKQSNENTRRALILRLRAKLKYKFLKTIHSIGYTLQIG